MIDGDTIVHPYASTRLFAWEDPMGCPKRHGAAGVEQNINYDDLCSKKVPRASRADLDIYYNCKIINT